MEEEKQACSASQLLSSASLPSFSLASIPHPTMDINMNTLIKNLLDILDNQEVSLFSISVDDVTPSVRAHLQAAKTSNMYAFILLIYYYFLSLP
jgi:hypothetical protein